MSSNRLIDTCEYREIRCLSQRWVAVMLQRLAFVFQGPLHVVGSILCPAATDRLISRAPDTNEHVGFLPAKLTAIDKSHDQCYSVKPGHQPTKPSFPSLSPCGQYPRTLELIQRYTHEPPARHVVSIGKYHRRPEQPFISVQTASKSCVAFKRRISSWLKDTHILWWNCQQPLATPHAPQLPAVIMHVALNCRITIAA